MSSQIPLGGHHTVRHENMSKAALLHRADWICVSLLCQKMFVHHPCNFQRDPLLESPCHASFREFHSHHVLSSDKIAVFAVRASVFAEIWLTKCVHAVMHQRCAVMCRRPMHHSPMFQRSLQTSLMSDFVLYFCFFPQFLKRMLTFTNFRELS